MSDTNSKIDALLRKTMISFLSTLNKDGSPNTMPLWHEWDGEKILMFSAGNAGKVARLRRDPRAALTVAEGVGIQEAWARVEGTVELVDELQRARDFACGLAERYYAPDRAKETIAAWSKADDLLLLDLKPTRIQSIWGPYSK